MATAQIFFDPNYEHAIIQDSGKPKVTRHIRDEASASRFASDMGYVVASAWEILHTCGASTYWERASLRRAA